MTTYAIPDDASFTGNWWLPSDASRRIPGSLAWSKNQAKLQLHDSFIPLRSGPLTQSSQSQPVIHGTTTNSKLISMLDALWSRGDISFGQAGLQRPESFISSLIVIGDHVDKQTLYSEVRVRIPGLQTLLEIGQIEETHIPKSEQSASCQIYRASGVEEERINILAIGATLGWGIDRQFAGDRLTNLTITSAAHLRIAPDRPQTMDWFLEQLNKATTLLAFIAGSPMTSDKVTAKVAESSVSVSILIGWATNDCYCPYKHQNEFFLLRRTMAADLATVFSTWYEKYEMVAMPSKLALSVLSSEGPWIHIQFLLLMQALEGFHRAIADGTYMPPEDYEAVRHTLTTAIPSSVGANHRDALKSRIKYGNELSLRKRINSLAEHLDAPLRERIFGGTGAIPRKWIATRNYYTHWDEASRSDVLDTPGMYYATVRLRHFLRALYLTFTGISQTAILRSLDGASKESQHLLQLNHSAATLGHVNVHHDSSSEPDAAEPHTGD